MITPDQAQLLGEIKGIVSQMQVAQAEHGSKLDKLDNRLRDQEATAARQGAYAGTAVAIGMALIIEGAKSFLRIKGGGQGGS